MMTGITIANMIAVESMRISFSWRPIGPCGSSNVYWQPVRPAVSSALAKMPDRRRALSANDTELNDALSLIHARGARASGPAQSTIFGPNSPLPAPHQHGPASRANALTWGAWRFHAVKFPLVGDVV